MRISVIGRSAIALVLLGGAVEAAAQSVEREDTWVSPSGTRLKLFIDKANLGGAEVEMGEITFAAGADSGEHAHSSTEIFYVISGELEHIVNGESHLLKPGMVGYVRPPDKVRHKVGAAGPAKALVIWAPGGEAARILANWKKEP